MRINDLEKMQQNLNQMRKNLESIHRIDLDSSSKKRKKGRRAVKKESNKIIKSKLAKEEQVVIMITIAIVIFTFVFSTSIFAKTISENNVENQTVNDTQQTQDNTYNSTKSDIQMQEDQEEKSDLVLENNENAIQLEEILLENVSILKSKEYVEEERALPFETIYNENPNLPEGEEVLTKEGIDGKQQVKAIRTYENDVLVSEDMLESVIIENYIPEEIDVGTSKFLSKNQAHLGDTMYLTTEVTLMDSADDSANEICTILQSIDVTLEELNGEDWCKIIYDGLEGYVQSENLTTSTVCPEIVEANRVQRIKMTLEEDMPLNQSTTLTLDDYIKILSGNSGDKNNIIEENAEAFYNADKTYNINGVFVAAIAIHESGWGTSSISQNKKNLFGYGAYDSSPYSSSYTFDTYAEGIELISKVLVKYYLNEEGTPIYEDEVAKGSYYNGPTISGVNTRYASDTNWHNKVYNYMQYLYNRL